MTWKQFAIKRNVWGQHKYFKQWRRFSCPRGLCTLKFTICEKSADFYRKEWIFFFRLFLFWKQLNFTCIILWFKKFTTPAFLKIFEYIMNTDKDNISSFFLVDFYNYIILEKKYYSFSKKKNCRKIPEWSCLEHHVQLTCNVT